MPLPAWPAISYNPIPSTWKKSPLRPPIRTEMEGGNVRQRRRPGDNVAIITQTLVLTVTEFDTLESWVNSTLAGGTARFTMSVILGDSYVSKTVQFEPNGQDFPYSIGWLGTAKRTVAMTLRVFGV